MSLPLPWVDRIFLKLTLVYGRDFTGLMDGIDEAKVKADWAHELSGYGQSPDSISYALQNLPEGKPPTVIEFRAIARRRMVEAQNPPLPKPNPEMAAKVIGALMQRHGGAAGNKDWAKRILARADAGDQTAPIALKFAKEALAPRTLAHA